MNILKGYLWCGYFGYIISELLWLFLQNSDGEMHRQLEYIQKLHNGQGTLEHPIYSDDEEEDTVFPFYICI